MKVLFTFGGLPHYYNYVLNRLNKLPGIEIVVIVPAIKSDTLGKGVHETSAGIEFRVIRLKESKSWYGKLYFKKFAETIKDEKPDIIVTIWPYVLGFSLIPSWKLLRKRLKFKLIYKDIPFNIPKYKNALKYFRDQLNIENNTRKNHSWGLKKVIYYTIFREIMKQYLKAMDGHVYYTEDAYDIIPSYGVDPGKIFITYNSPDTDKLFDTKEQIERELHSNEIQKKIILHVGRLVEWKKVDLLIKAFKLVQSHHPESELWIIGDGPETENLKMLAKDSGNGNYIKFFGALYDPMELGRKFMQASVYVLAGMGGLSINEAMVFGKPIICTRADGTEKKLVRNGINGYYFREDNEADLADKINLLLSNPEIIKSFGENSLNIIKNEVNIHTVIEGYRKAFNFVTKTRVS